LIRKKKRSLSTNQVIREERCGGKKNCRKKRFTKGRELILKRTCDKKKSDQVRTSRREGDGSTGKGLRSLQLAKWEGEEKFTDRELNRKFCV